MIKIQEMLKKYFFHQKKKKRRKIKRIKTVFIRIRISKLLNDSTASKIATKKWIEENDLSSGQYSVNKSIMLKTSMLKVNLCDYIGAYIAKGHIKRQQLLNEIMMVE